LLKRAKANGHTAFVITAGILVIGWCPHDRGIPDSPAGHGFGVSDPASVFMGCFGLEPRHKRLAFPYTQDSIQNLTVLGDPVAQQAMFLGKGWAGEIASGIFRSWDEIQFIKDNWDGQIILKGILVVEVTPSSGRSTSTQFSMFVGC
ncbi:hypothetical protein PAXRUDRAFT_798518, partial [Paxillus rubicundulus Ve08.2h10]